MKLITLVGLSSYLLASVLWVGPTLAAQANQELVAASDVELAKSAKDALKSASVYMRSIATNGGYLFKYSLDGSIRYGEDKATDTQIWLQPPGTPVMGMAFLNAYDATGDSYYLDVARDAAMALVTGQLESGGWDNLIDFDPKQLAQWYLRSDIGKLTKKQIKKRDNTSSYDDDKTQSGLRFLMQYLEASANQATDAEIQDALDYGLKKILDAQYPNGAWPQRYKGKARNLKDFPIVKASIPKDYPRQYEKIQYSSHYTLNDDTQRDVIQTMLMAWKQFDDVKYKNAALRGGNFLLLAQLPEPQPIWAQQYNAQMEPTWGRAFEPPSASGGESVGVIRTLAQLYVEFGEEKFLEPIPRAMKWYERSMVAPGVWNRMYELGTNKAIFGDRDGKIHYTLEEVSEERQNGYSWYDDFNFDSTKRYYEKVIAYGRERMLKKLQPKVLSADKKRSLIKSMTDSVKKTIAALDKQGRWVTRKDMPDKKTGLRELIETKLFIKNAEILYSYLKLVE